jgi:hypothetical protein
LAGAPIVHPTSLGHSRPPSPRSTP